MKIAGSDTRARDAVQAPGDTTPIDPEWDDLWLLTIGGVPAATATTDACNTDELVVASLSGHTRTGAGALLLQHLQATVAAADTPWRRLSISAWNTIVADVYRARGLRPDPRRGNPILDSVWEPPPLG